MSLLEFVNVYFSNEDNFIIKNLSFKIEAGDFISIVGPSGSGKSSLLKLCSHLHKPSSGKILYKSIDMLDYNPIEIRKNICYCFQTPYLFGENVLENLVFPYKIRNKTADMNRVKYLLNIFNMSTDYLEKDITNLSGGEKQRISLIRSLIFKPEALLLDEVTSALDVDNTKIVENIINNLNKEGVTILWITHNPEQSRKYANKILTIENGSLKSLEVLR
ncbi:ATP-binding cassette domain-containing protein [Clostridium sp. OS1-26]|uniref:ABC transporter ATP-binding protein n=1 Tax=Clostridium sp. OS1-26 TaxID=3070681 RepID=UPI0027E05989|nr:ATP-binding cassette domain-containing protein [Clostridium sp. OS1-26]WML35031.1 ATP-binding cassette domain-containing protein [Clostridium sp. OS1-26]